MMPRRVLMCSSPWIVVPSLLRPPLGSNMPSSCLRLSARLPALSRHYITSARHGSKLGTPLPVGQGQLLRRTLHFVQKYWKRCLTAGTLCGSGVLLGRMAVSEDDTCSIASAHPDKYQSYSAEDSGTYSAHVADQSTYCEATFSKFSLREKVYVVLRCVYLTFIFCPAVVLYALSRLFRSSRLESTAWSYTMKALQTAGPAFIKLGQWASTRRDIFSEEFCNSLSQLHASCQFHRWQDTIRTLEEEFGHDWENILEISDPQPIGSGCVAQVYKGRLKRARMVSSGEEGSREEVERRSSSFLSRLMHKYFTKSTQDGESESGEEEMVPVAVKVLHPGTVHDMERDMLLMRYGAYWADWLNPDFHWVALKECFSEFASVMRKQLDMELEAHNLRRFQHLMGDNDCIKFPTPLFPYVTKRVLVETYEPGTHISRYMDNPGGKLQKDLARIGTDALLDMLFIHNFIHGDLHPGNILVQESQRPRLVLLDCGIATSLTQFDLNNMRAVFTAIVKKQGENVADLMLGSQPCPTVEEYRKSMAELVTRGVNNLTMMQNANVSSIFTDLFDVLIKHKVRIEPNYTSVVMAIMVIEGLGRSLDPSLNLLEVVKPCLLHKARRDLTAKTVGS